MKNSWEGAVAVELERMKIIAERIRVVQLNPWRRISQSKCGDALDVVNFVSMDRSMEENEKGDKGERG